MITSRNHKEVITRSITNTSPKGSLVSPAKKVINPARRVLNPAKKVINPARKVLNQGIRTITVETSAKDNLGLQEAKERTAESVFNNRHGAVT